MERLCQQPVLKNVVWLSRAIKKCYTAQHFFSKIRKLGTYSSFYKEIFPVLQLVAPQILRQSYQKLQWGGSFHNGVLFHFWMNEKWSRRALRICSPSFLKSIPYLRHFIIHTPSFYSYKRQNLGFVLKGSIFYQPLSFSLRT